MLNLTFTRDEILSLMSISGSPGELIRDKILRMAEAASEQGLTPVEDALAVPPEWHQIGLRAHMIPAIIRAYEGSTVGGPSGNKITCIKEIRSLTNAGLKESKDCCEQYIVSLIEARKRKAAVGHIVPDDEET